MNTAFSPLETTNGLGLILEQMQQRLRCWLRNGPEWLIVKVVTDDSMFQKNVPQSFPLVRIFGVTRISVLLLSSTLYLSFGQLYLSYFKHTIKGKGTWLQGQWPHEGGTINILILWTNNRRYSKMKLVPKFTQLENNRARGQTQFFVIPRPLPFFGNDRKQNTSRIGVLQTGTGSCHWGHIVPTSSGPRAQAREDVKEPSISIG